MPSEISPLPPKYLQQEETISQECENLISTLPKEKGWLASNLYQYQGFWYPVRHLQGVISCQKQFTSQESDIFLATTPKSGTTWLKALLFTLVNRKRHPVNKNHPLITKNPHDLVPFLEIKLYADNQIPDIDSFLSPRVFATHLPYLSLPETVKNKSSKIVYLCRNPKATFVSLWHFSNNLRLKEMGTNSIHEVFDRYCEGISLFGPFWDHVLEYWKQSKENNGDKVIFLKFEDIKEQPGVHLRRLARFLGCPFTADEEEQGLVEEILKMCSFENLSSLDINKNGKLSSGEENKAFFRKGETEDWKNYLDAAMVSRMDQITTEKFDGSGLVL